jgi:DNA-binding CsgD family transcriptional regulator
LKGVKPLARLNRKLKAAVQPVTNTPEELEYKRLRTRPLPSSKVIEVKEAEPTKPPSDYITIEVKGSTGKVYKIVVPQSYIAHIPKTWSWNAQRYKVAELISAGIPMTEIAKIMDMHRSVIYGLLQHPEFKEHVDGLTLETGWANKRERIAGLNRVTRVLFDKVMNEVDKVKLTDKSIGAVLTAIQMIAKQLGQEKEEFVERSKVDQKTTLDGAIGVAEVKVEQVLSTKTAEERQALEEEFNKMGDDIIRAITGEKG